MYSITYKAFSLFTNNSDYTDLLLAMLLFCFRSLAFNLLHVISRFLTVAST